MATSARNALSVAGTPRRLQAGGWRRPGRTAGCRAGTQPPAPTAARRATPHTAARPSRHLPAGASGGRGAPQGAGRERDLQHPLLPAAVEAQQLIAPAGAEALAAPPVLCLRLARARLARQTLRPRPSVAHGATDLTLTNTFKHRCTRLIHGNQPPALANESCCQYKSELLPYLIHGGRAATKRAASGARQGTTASLHLQYA